MGPKNILQRLYRLPGQRVSQRRPVDMAQFGGAQARFTLTVVSFSFHLDTGLIRDLIRMPFTSSCNSASLKGQASFTATDVNSSFGLGFFSHGPASAIATIGSIETSSINFFIKPSSARPSYFLAANYRNHLHPFSAEPSGRQVPILGSDLFGYRHLFTIEPPQSLGAF